MKHPLLTVLRDRAPLLCFGGLLLLAAVNYLFTLPCVANLSDEGYLLLGTDRVLAGQIPGANFSAYAPGRYYLLAGLFKLFGREMIVARLCWMLLRLATVALLFHLLRRRAGTAAASVLTLIMVIAPGPWHKTLNPLLITILLWGFSRITDPPHQGRPRDWLLCGVLTSATLLLVSELFPCALLTAPLLLISATRVGRPTAGRRLLPWLAGLSLPLLPIMVVGLLSGQGLHLLQAGVSFFWGRTTIVINPYLGQETPLGLLGSGEISAILLGSMIIALGILVLIGISAWVLALSRRSPASLALAALLPFAVFALMLTWNQPDLSHFLQILPIPLLLGVTLLSHRLPPPAFFPGRILPLAGCAATLMIVAALSSDEAYSAGTFRMCPSQRRPLHLEGAAHMVASRERAAVLQQTIRYIQDHLGPERWLLTVNLPLLSFLSRARNPLAFDLFFARSSGNDPQQTIEQLKKVALPLVVLDRRFLPDEGLPTVPLPLPRFAPRIHSYLFQHYHPVLRLDEFLIMRQCSKKDSS